MSVTGGTIFSTGGTIVPPVNMLYKVLALNNIQHTSGSVNFPFHVEEPYIIPPAYAKKKQEYRFCVRWRQECQNLRTTDGLRTQGDMNTKLAYVRKKTCVRKDKNTAPGQNYGRIYLVLFTKPVLLTFTSNRLQGT